MAGRKGEKFWADAVTRAVNRRLEDQEGQPKKLEALADRLVEAGLAGEVTALKEIGDRLDGKPHQTNDSHNTHDVADPLSELFKQVAENSGRIGKG